MNTMPYIAHVISEYLGHTLNWVYTQIKHVHTFTPYVLTEKVANLSAYPVRMVFSPEKPPNRASYLDRFQRRLGVFPFLTSRCYSSALKEYPPALVHAHFGWDGYFARALKRKFRIPLITQFYGYDVGILPRIPLWQRRYRQLFAEGDLFLVEGGNMKSIIEGLGCPSDKIIVHHLGIELDTIKHVRRDPAPNAFRILIAASFKEKKGIEYALRAVALARRNIEDTAISLHIIGDGALKQNLQNLAHDLGLDEATRWLGYQTHPEFVNALYNADVFLSPSVTASDGDTEGGAPVAIIEAAASGLPVISTTHADIAEVVLHGRTGLLAQERDAAQLADAICALAARAELRHMFGEAARKHVEEGYSAAKQGIKLEEIYETVSKQRKL